MQIIKIPSPPKKIKKTKTKKKLELKEHGTVRPWSIFNIICVCVCVRACVCVYTIIYVVGAMQTAVRQY